MDIDWPVRLSYDTEPSGLTPPSCSRMSPVDADGPAIGDGNVTQGWDKEFLMAYSDAFQDAGRLPAPGDNVAIASRSLPAGTRIDHNGRWRHTMCRLTAIGLSLGVMLLLGTPLATFADEVKIEHTVFKKRGDAWTVETTLRHGDTGWEHYADAWRVVDAAGQELGQRVLLHPHQNEQPFTRSLNGLTIPSETRIVYVEAHDKVHGWSKQRIRVDLQQAKGERFEVEP